MTRHHQQLASQIQEDVGVKVGKSGHWDLKDIKDWVHRQRMISIAAKCVIVLSS